MELIKIVKLVKLQFHNLIDIIVSNTIGINHIMR